MLSRLPVDIIIIMHYIKYIKFPLVTLKTKIITKLITKIIKGLISPPSSNNKNI